MAAGEGIETMLSLRMRHAEHADDRGALGQSPRRPAVPAALRRLYIARDGDPAGRRRDGELERPRPRRPGSRRSPCRRRWAISTRISASSASTNFGQSVRMQLAPGRRGPLHASGRRPRRGEAVCVDVGRSHRMAMILPSRKRPRPWPSRGRSDGKRPGPATAGLALFSAVPADAGFASRDKNSRRPPSSAGAPAARRCARRCRPGPPAVR